jgi:hypothetical protein
VTINFLAFANFYSIILAIKKLIEWTPVFQSESVRVVGSNPAHDESSVFRTDLPANELVQRHKIYR